jgi:hypothetical protein
VKLRVRRRSAVRVLARAVMVGIGVAAVVGCTPLARPGPGPTPAVARSPLRPFVCGDRLELGPGAGPSRAGLTMTLGEPRKLTDADGPGLTVTFTSDRPLRVQGSPPNLYEVLYLRDEIIVGGGPMLNRSGDLTPQGVELIGYGFDVDPNRPYTVDLGRHDKLCSDRTWPAVWSEAHSYQVVLVQGPVVPGPGDGPDQVLLDIPALGRSPLIAARAGLSP